MLKFTLCKPMILDVQVREIAEAYHVDESELFDVLNGFKVYPKHAGDAFGPAMTPQEALDNGYTKDELYSGTDAIIQMCNEIGQPFENCITEVDVPVDFYYESCPVIWNDVCDLFARAENRNTRFKTLLDMNAPKIILRNEERMLRQYLEQLEHNNLQGRDGDEPLHRKHKDGRIYRALNDGGYSMIHGWDKEIVERREREYEEFLKEVSDVDTDTE